MCVIVDEAYCEFNTLDDPDASVDLLTRHQNLVLLRTFSRSTGSPACASASRCAATEAFRAAVDQVRQPFFANVAAQAAATEALRHQDEVLRRVELTIASRLELEDGPPGLGLPVAESHANFAWCDLPARTATRPRSCAAWPSAACSCAPAPPSGARARCA